MKMVVSMKMEKEDVAYLEGMRAYLQKQTGIPTISRSWVMTEMMRMGRSEFEREHNISKTKVLEIARKIRAKRDRDAA